MTDFNAVRDQILGDKDVRDEDRIEVNQRHLIDKILARYSSEYTVYREVLQNANDAGASSFEIEFHTISNRNNLRSNSLILDKNLNSVDLDIRDSRVTAVTLRNNGRPFDENDWSRLKKIAEGNPDETKVGFFGVGFYSLFSICEEPIVISGEKCLAFYWRGDQLYARSGKAPSSHDSKWTSIHLKIREKDYDFPHPDSFAHFCSKAILFTQFLDGIFVYLYPEVRLKESDENLNVSENSNNNIKELIFSVLKKRAIAQDLSIQPKDTLKNKARTIPNGIFSLTRANCQPIQIDLYKRYTSFHLSSETNSGSLFTSLWTIAKALVKSKAQEAAEKMQKAPGLFSLFLRVINCEVEVNCSSSLVKDMERSTKKRPPKSTKLHLLYRNYDEAQASHDGYDLKIVHPVLEGVLPAIPLIQTGYKNVDQKTIGKLFIGFETHQTTGLGFHIAGPFIPTVERESLDFVDRALAQWNEELLRACGILCRCIYDNEVYLISTLYSHQDLVSFSFYDSFDFGRQKSFPKITGSEATIF